MADISTEWRSLMYTHIDSDGKRTSDNTILHFDNVFHLLNQDINANPDPSWDHTTEELTALGLAPILESDRVYQNGDSDVEISLGDVRDNEDGTFTQLYVETEINTAEKVNRWILPRRNSEFHSSDWTQMNDSPLNDSDKAAWATYRQALRDLPTAQDWANVKNIHQVVWPTPPGADEPDAAVAAAANPFLDE
jgi:hypothetical protein